MNVSLTNKSEEAFESYQVLSNENNNVYDVGLTYDTLNIVVVMADGTDEEDVMATNFAFNDIPWGDEVEIADGVIIVDVLSSYADSAPKEIVVMFDGEEDYQSADDIEEITSLIKRGELSSQEKFEIVSPTVFFFDGSVKAVIQ
jgi:hypothetical protein